MRKVLILGPQGSGKSTQGKLLAQFLRLPYISTGDIFRTMTGKIKQVLYQGRLVDDQTTSEIVKKRLNQKDCQNGFVLDGYPRTLEQVKLFDPPIDGVFYLDLSDTSALNRLLKRGRVDDTPQSIKTRLDLYYKKTKPLLNHYRNLSKLIEIEASGSIEEVQQRIRDVVNG